MKRTRITRLSTGLVATALLASTCITPAVAAPETQPQPKNVIYLIGDGMGYNFLDLYNAYHTNKVHYQVQTGGDHKAYTADGINSPRPTEGFQSWNHLAMQTHWINGNPYDSQLSWGDFNWNKENPTDSAAAGTAMATGVKTYNAGLGVDVNEQKVENLSERAHTLGKSAGVVSSVPFSHATPAAFSAHNVSRNNYTEIAHEQVYGDMEVVMGAGHPQFDDNHQKLAAPNYKYIAQNDYTALESGQTNFSLVDDNSEFEQLTTGETPDRVFGIAQTASTLQQSRTDEAKLNDVVDLPTMTKGALNVLDNDQDGFFLMVEGGAIDWSGHANQSERSLTEVEDFFATVDAVTQWVETNSSWDETMVIVTADHETGYLSGDPGAAFNPMKPQGVGNMPTHTWNSTNHTNQLAPFFYRGGGSEQVLEARSVGRDTVRGHYIDNTTVANWLLDEAWTDRKKVEFTDIVGNPFEKEITWLGNTGISNGWPDDTYRPLENIDRGAIAAYFYRMAGEPEFNAPATPTFKDVPKDHVFHKEIEWMAAQGITTGWDDGTFRPAEPLKRDAMAAFFYRFAGQPYYVAPRQSQFTDVDPSQVFYKEISWMQSRGLSQGWPDGTYQPFAPIKRDAIAAFIYRYHDHVLNTI